MFSHFYVMIWDYVAYDEYGMISRGEVELTSPSLQFFLSSIVGVERWVCRRDNRWPSPSALLNTPEDI